MQALMISEWVTCWWANAPSNEGTLYWYREHQIPCMRVTNIAMGAGEVLYGFMPLQSLP